MQPKKRRAQQLVEFLLVAPFMIIILGILVEYAYALNVNLTINQGLKEVTSFMYADIRPNMPVEDIQASVLTELETYLDDNNISTSTDNNLEVKYLTLGDTTVFTATYKYIPAFTLPTAYFKFIPDELNFFATSAVPTAFLNPNNYGTGISTSTLDGTWGAQKGLQNDVAAQGRVLFLKQVGAGLYNSMNWSGSWDNCVLDSTTAVMSGATCAFNGVGFKPYLSAKGYSSIFFAHDPSAVWTEVRDRTVALTNSSKDSLGNFDMSPAGTYNVVVSGSNIFAYSTSQDNITNLK